MNILDIPLIIPKKRLMGVVVGILLTSIVFVTTNSVLYSMTQVSEDIFGTDDDVIIFYNTAGTTPFTSRISTLYDEALRLQPEVIAVSPEIFQAITINGQSAYLRGVNYEDIKSIDNLEIIQGQVNFENWLQTAIIGDGLANRLGLNLNDQIEVASIVTEERIIITITGIYTSESVSNDEIIVNHEIGRVLADFENDAISHYRIKFDPSRIEGSTIIENVQKRYGFKVNFNIGNKTNLDDLNFEINHKSGIVVYNQGYENSSISINLIIGTYQLILTNKNTIFYNNSYLITSNDVITLDIEENVFQNDFTFTYNNQTAQNAIFEIHEDTNVIDTITIEERTISTFLPQGSYNGSIKDDLDTFYFQFNVTGVNQITKNFQYNPVMFTYFENNTIFLENEIKIGITNFDQDFNLLVNQEIQNTINIENRSLSLNLNNGNHNLTLEINSNIYYYYSFEINSTLNYFDLNFDNNDYLNKSDKISIEIDGIRDETILSNHNIETIGNTAILSLDNFEVGYHSIYLEGQNYENRTISRFRTFIVTNENFAWYSPANYPVLKYGDQITVWGASEPDFNNTMVEIINEVDKEYLIEINYNSTDNKLHSILNSNSKLTAEFVNNYSSLFKINDMNISTINIINNSVLIFHYPNFTYPFHSEEFWEISILYEGENYNVYDNQEFYINSSISLVNLSISIKNVITGTIEVFHLLVNSTKIQYIQNNIFGLPKFDIDGIINLVGWKDYNITIVKDAANFDPIYLEEQLIQLSSGNYTIIIENASNTTFWDLEIIRWQNSLNLDFLSINERNLNSSMTVGISGVYFGNKVSVVSKYILNHTIFRNIMENEIEISLTNFIEGNVSIRLDGTLIDEFQLNQTEFSLDSSHKGIYNIEIYNLNLRNQIELYNFSFASNIDQFEYSVKLNHLQYDSLFNLTIYGYETQQTIEFNNYVENQLLNFTLIPQIIAIDVFMTNQNIFSQNFTLNSFSEIIEIITGKSWVNFEIDEPNFNLTYNIFDRIDLISEDSIINLQYQNLDSIELDYNVYVLRIDTVFGNFNYDFIPNGNESVLISIPIINSTINFQIVNLEAPLTAKLYLTNNYTLSYYIFDFNFRINQRELSIPVGFYNMLLNGTWGILEENLQIFNNNTNLVIALEIEGQLPIEFDLENALKAEDVGISVSGDYLDNFLRGALLIIQSIIITEIIVMIVIIFVNFNEIIRFLVIESKTEIKILERIGGTQNQIFIGLVKPLILFSLLLPLISLVISELLLKLMFTSNLTVFFGHQFSPTAFNYIIVSTNFIVTYGLLIYSVKVSLKNELGG